METISVIIPTFNREKMLYRALESVVNQKNVDTEIIVVDDGSSDKTEQMIKRNFHDIKYLKQDNRGVSAARNLGITNATGNFIALLDSDDEWKLSKLEKQIDFLQNNLKYNAVHCNEKWFNRGREIGQKKYHDRSSTGLFKRSLRRCLISPSSILVRKELFDKVLETPLFDTTSFSNDFCEALENMLNSKLKNTETNSELFNSMNKPS